MPANSRHCLEVKSASRVREGCSSREEMGDVNRGIGGREVNRGIGGREVNRGIGGREVNRGIGGREVNRGIGGREVNRGWDAGGTGGRVSCRRTFFF